MARTMTGAEMVFEALADQGVEHHLRLSGRRGPADLRRDLPAGEGPAHPRPPGAGRGARGRRLCALDRQGRRRAGDLGPGRDQRRDGPHRRADGFHSARLHHRPGADAPHRQRRLPGMRYGRHHAALHQAQLRSSRTSTISRACCTRRSISRARPAGSRRRRHSEGRAVRERQLCRPDEHPAQDLPAAAEAGSDGRARSRRADGAAPSGRSSIPAAASSTRVRRRASCCASSCGSPAIRSPRR